MTGKKFSGKKFSGKTVYNGSTIGKVMVFRNHQEPVRRKKVEDAEQEIGRVHHALEDAKRQLAGLYDKSCAESVRSGRCGF